MYALLYTHTLFIVTLVICTPLQTYDAEEFKKALFYRSDPDFGLSRFLLNSNAISAYDGVWTIAKAWKSVLNCQNSTGSTVTKELERALDEISVSVLPL